MDFRTGYRVDLERIREAVGNRLLSVDAIQGFGVIAEDWTLADIVVAGGQKWMRAGLGKGFLALSDRALDQLLPVATNWAGIEDSLNLHLRARFDFSESQNGKSAEICVSIPTGKGWPAGMTQPYSEDLRERTMARLNAGETIRSIAPSCVSKWKKRLAEAGALTPGRVGGRAPLLPDALQPGPQSHRASLCQSSST